MKDYIVFTVADNQYAIAVESIERIIQIPHLTPIPNSHKCIDGMMSYEKRVTKVVNFRRLTDLPTYESELVQVFAQIKHDHERWVSTLMEAISKNLEFSLTTDPHACRLGKWLDNYSTHDSDVLAILKVLRPVHARLHEMGHEALALREEDPEMALTILKRDISKIYETTIGEIDKMIALTNSISEHLQRLLIYRSGENFFAIKVDTIEDMVRIDDSMIKAVETIHPVGAFVETDGVVEIENRLVNVIQSVILPIRGGV